MNTSLMNRESLNEKELRAKNYVCLALDLNHEQEILQCVDELADLVGIFKLNSAFTLFGPSLVRQLLDRGCKVFLDLKIHDIPNTVGWYADAATRLGVHMVTLHTSGGSEMMRKAVVAATVTGQKFNLARPKFIGVTVLTSIEQKTLNEEMNIAGSVEQEVSRKAELAITSGLDGIVCSAADLPALQVKKPKGFIYVTPGVRQGGADHHDQKRVLSYSEAIAAGSDLLVVGRSIVGAADRRAAAREVLREVAKEI